MDLSSLSDILILLRLNISQWLKSFIFPYCFYRWKQCKNSTGISYEELFSFKNIKLGYTQVFNKTELIICHLITLKKQEMCSGN